MKKLFKHKLFDRSTFFCFTPGVMLATFFIELILAIYVLIRYRLSAIGRLIALTLTVLGLFQLAEYQVCSSANPIFWAQLGFVLITILPALGLHIISFATGKKHFVNLAYFIVAAYALIFLLVPNAITNAVCGGNYIVFELNSNIDWTYGIYYLAFLFLGLWEIIEKLMEIKKSGTDKNRKPILWWLFAGYLSFIGPMAIVYAFSMNARLAVASIMCGFAVLLAIILAFKIAPLYRKISS